MYFGKLEPRHVSPCSFLFSPHQQIALFALTPRVLFMKYVSYIWENQRSQAVVKILVTISAKCVKYLWKFGQILVNIKKTLLKFSNSLLYFLQWLLIVMPQSDVSEESCQNHLCLSLTKINPTENVFVWWWERDVTSRPLWGDAMNWPSPQLMCQVLTQCVFVWTF